MNGWPECEYLGFEWTVLIARQVGRVGQDADVDGMSREDGKEVFVRGHDELSNVVCHGRFNDLEVVSIVVAHELMCSRTLTPTVISGSSSATIDIAESSLLILGVPDLPLCCLVA